MAKHFVVFSLLWSDVTERPNLSLHVFHVDDIKEIYSYVPEHDMSIFDSVILGDEKICLSGLVKFFTEGKEESDISSKLQAELNQTIAIQTEAWTAINQID